MGRKEVMHNVTIKGNKLVCPVCNSKHFRARKTLMNTVGFSFFNLDRADKKAQNYVCDNCGYVYWFPK